MKPRVSILNPSFRYVPSTNTNIRETFDRVRREQQRVAAEQREPPPKLLPLFARQKGQQP